MRPSNLTAMGTLACLALAACATTPAMAPPGPPNYQAGYMHGCDTGESEAGNPWQVKKRDWTAYRGDPLYKQGWDEGRQACMASYNAIRR